MGRLRSRPSAPASSGSSLRLPSWSSPPPIRPAQKGIIAPRWCVMTTRSGCRSKRPEKTSRPIATLRLVRPAEGPPQVVLRARLAGVVGDRGRPRRMHPDRQTVLGHAREDRLVLGQIERPTVDVGEDLHARRAELSDARGRSRAGPRRDCSSAATRRSRGSDPDVAPPARPSRRWPAARGRGSPPGPPPPRAAGWRG